MQVKLKDAAERKERATKKKQERAARKNLTIGCKLDLGRWLRSDNKQKEKAEKEKAVKREQ